MAKLVIGTNKTIVVPALVKEKKEKYPLLSSVYGYRPGFSNTEIGSVIGYQKDSQGHNYAVVVLQPSFINSTTRAYLSTSNQITGIPLENTQALWESTQTATENTQATLDFATSIGEVAQAADRCRSFEFINVTGQPTATQFNGQCPTISQLVKIVMYQNELNTKYNTSVYCCNESIWSSSQNTATNGWHLTNDGRVTNKNKTSKLCVIPVLELPID